MEDLRYIFHFRPYIIVEKGRPKVTQKHMQDLDRGLRFVLYLLTEVKQLVVLYFVAISFKPS